MKKLSNIVLFFVLFSGNSLAKTYPVTNNEGAIQAKDIKTVYFNGSLPDTGRVNVTYGDRTRFVCGVKISEKEQIRWTMLSKVLALSASQEYEFNPTMDYHGKYISCQVIKANKSVGQTYAATVLIGNLLPPEIEGPVKYTETIIENSNLTISCKISEGVPPPQLSWVMKGFGSNKIVSLPGSSSELIIQNATLANAAEYTCTATNIKNKRDFTKFKTIEVVVQKVPVAVVEEGNELTFPYGVRVELSCRVEGFPLPKTVWKDSQGNIVQYSNTIVNWHQKISRVTINQIKVSNNYSCFSENTIGQAVRSVSINVLSPFVIHEYPKAAYDVHFGEPARIVCNITSSISMSIKWFHQKTNTSEKSEISHGNAFRVSSDATTLMIRSVEMEFVGKYTCVATLDSDKEEIKIFSTDVQIDNLAAPVLSSTKKLTVMENDWITLYCAIVAGVPPPKITWQFMARGGTAFEDLERRKREDLSAASEEFDMKNITLKDAGQYRCVAQNVMGKTEVSTDVTVRKAPVTDITEGPAITVQYWSNVTLTCSVVAFPQPSLVWTDSAGNIVAAKETTLNDHEKSSQITVAKMTSSSTFSCTAMNILGKSTSQINVAVLPPFIVHEHPQDPTNVHYAASTDLICNITSLFPMRIRWFHNSSEIRTSPQHNISEDGTEMTIGRMDLDLIGKYKCEAFLVDNVDEKMEYSADVVIDDLKAPVITSNNGSSVTIQNLEEMSLSCTAEGNPAPIIKWQALTSGSSSFQNLGEGDTISTTNIGYAQAGQYICTASNVIGEDKKQFSVAVV